DEPHNCWTTTEAALTSELSEDLRDAWERLRETAVEFGEQRIYASHNSIMFSRKACYFFVKPMPKHLGLWIFLGPTGRAPQILKSAATSRTKVCHHVRIVHRDQVESPITDWLQEAYNLQDIVAASPDRRRPRATTKRRATSKRKKKKAR